jgi:lipoprotein-anchoring transpeptidase ErfK/SrfK
MPGVRVAGLDVGGMTGPEIERALAPRVAEILGRRITVRVGARTWTRTAESLGVRVDLEGAVSRALAVGNDLGWADRALRRLLDRPVAASIDLAVSYRAGPVRRLAGLVAERTEVAPRDASLDFVDGHLVVHRSRPGRTLDPARVRRAIRAAVRGEGDEVVLTPRKVRPAVTERDLGPTIVVRVSELRLYLYRGTRLVRSYPVATGQLGRYPTPLGHWRVVGKRVNPTWVNPAPDGWGASLPRVIPPGPGNPLGTRALDLDAQGIRIHGTYDRASIGTHASHGCIRMLIPDSEELFDLVEVGTPVIVAW